MPHRGRISSPRCATSWSPRQNRDAKRRWRSVAKRYFDLVLVHGDEGVIPFGETFAAGGDDRRPHPLHRLCDRPRSPRRQRMAMGRSSSRPAAAPPARRSSAAALAARPLTRLRRPYLAVPHRTRPSRSRFRRGFRARPMRGPSSSAFDPILRRGCGSARSRSRGPATTRPWTSCSPERAPSWSRSRRLRKRSSDFVRNSCRRGLLTVLPAAVFRRSGWPRRSTRR